MPNKDKEKALKELVKSKNDDPRLSIEEVSEYFKEKVPTYKCPICGGNEFEVISSDKIHADTFSSTGIKFERNPGQNYQTLKRTEEPTIDVFIELCCKNCAFICKHNWGRLSASILVMHLEKLNEQYK